MGLFGKPTYADGDTLEVAGAPVRLKVSSRARRLSLRIDRIRREVIVTAPTARKLPAALDFARARAGWMADRLAELAPSDPLWTKEEIRLFGEPVRLERGPGRGKWIAACGDGPARMILPADDLGFSLALVRLVKRQALERLTALTAHYAELIGRPMPKVSVIDPKSRWGSCTPAGPGREAAIRYSWRLALAPFAVADYVAAHETAHLIEANHGPRFWALVHDLNGDHRPHRDWLKREGSALHLFGR
ncbi:MAG: SprT family zinc-dependent metalloprotease [Caulobacteraceae bacterium]